MNRETRRPVRSLIGLESLETRQVLSTVTPTALVMPIKGALTSGISYIDLQGKGHGSTTTVKGLPDVGTTGLEDFRAHDCCAEKAVA